MSFDQIHLPHFILFNSSPIPHHFLSQLHVSFSKVNHWVQVVLPVHAWYKAIY